MCVARVTCEDLGQDIEGWIDGCIHLSIYLCARAIRHLAEWWTPDAVASFYVSGVVTMDRWIDGWPASIHLSTY
jgi:hypothetical protein